MASRGVSARRYAEAVFELASETDSLVQWSRDLATVAGFVGENDITLILRSGRVPQSEKLRLLEAGLSSHVGPLAMNLVRILNQRGKADLARDVQVRFQEMVDERRGVAHAIVTTAVALSGDERRAVETRLAQITGKQVDVTPVVDANIIGGIVARIGDQLIDASTRTRLVALKRRLEAGGVAR